MVISILLCCAARKVCPQRDSQSQESCPSTCCAVQGGKTVVCLLTSCSRGISNLPCQQGAVASRLMNSPSYTDGYPGILSSDIEAYKYSRRLVLPHLFRQVDLTLTLYWVICGQFYCTGSFFTENLFVTGLSHRELSGSCDGVLQWGWHAWVCCQAQWSARDRKQVIYPISLLCLLVFTIATQTQSGSCRHKHLWLCTSSSSTIRRCCPNGSFESLSKQQLVLTSSPHCRWFFQQLVSAVDYLHKMVRCLQVWDAIWLNICHAEENTCHPLQVLKSRFLIFLRRNSKLTLHSALTERKGFFYSAFFMQGFASRDIKLDNVLLDKSRRPLLKLCDFGYSKVTLILYLQQLSLWPSPTALYSDFHCIAFTSTVNKSTSTSIHTFKLVKLPHCGKLHLAAKSLQTRPTCLVVCDTYVSEKRRRFACSIWETPLLVLWSAHLLIWPQRSSEPMMQHLTIPRCDSTQSNSCQICRTVQFTPQGEPVHPCKMSSRQQGLGLGDTLITALSNIITRHALIGLEQLFSIVNDTQLNGVNDDNVNMLNKEWFAAGRHLVLWGVSICCHYWHISFLQTSG